jgi:hypothetical protein
MIGDPPSAAAAISRRTRTNIAFLARALNDARVTRGETLVTG